MYAWLPGQRKTFILQFLFLPWIFWLRIQKISQKWKREVTKKEKKEQRKEPTTICNQLTLWHTYVIHLSTSDTMHANEHTRVRNVEEKTSRLWHGWKRVIQTLLVLNNLCRITWTYFLFYEAKEGLRRSHALNTHLNLESNTRPLVHCNADHAYTMTNGMSGILFILLLINKQIKAWNERTTTIKQPKEFSNDILL